MSNRIRTGYRWNLKVGYSATNPQQQQYPSRMLPAPSQQATNICQLCQSQGHYDYQCQFAGDFMARTQKLLTKVAHITTKIPIKESGQTVTMITMTLMGNLFSSRGSRCR